MNRNVRKVVKSLIVLYMFTLIFQIFAMNIVLEQLNLITGMGTAGNVQIVILEPETIPFPVTECALLDDYYSLYINWSDVSGADEYLVYYSSNLTAIRVLNSTLTPLNVENVTVNDLNWTDSSGLGNEVVRFYRVASKKFELINISDRICGKQIYNLKSSLDASKRNNLFGLIYNYNYNFSKYINSFCQEFPAICDSNLGIPTIQAIDRSNPEAQPYVTHPYGFVVGAGYGMSSGKGYSILVNQSYNKTEAGMLPELIVVNLSASSDASKRNNLFGDNYIEGENLSLYLDYICSQESQICDSNLGIPTIQAIDRRNPEAQPYVTHPYGFFTGAGYPMKSGEGYKILVNESIILILNNTVVR